METSGIPEEYPSYPSRGTLDKEGLRALKRARDNWYNRYVRRAKNVIPYNNTIPHEESRPIDDRPEYLKEGQPYVLAVDTETTGLAYYDGDYPFLATISDYDRDYLYRLEGPDAEGDREKLREDILKADVLLFHNASFDVCVLATSGIVTLDELLERQIHDSDILARCLLGADHKSFRLKDLAAEFVDPDAGASELAVKEAMVQMGLIKKPDQIRLPNGAHYQCWQVYPELMEKYAVYDTRITYDLYHILMDKADDDAKKIYLETEAPLIPVLCEMEYRGVRINRHKAQELFSLYSDQRATQNDKLFELNGYEDINLHADAQVADLLVRRGVPLTKTTARTGQLSVASWALEPFKGDEAIDALLEWASSDKLLSTFIEPMLDRSAVHPNFMQIGARTGRMSCRRPNMQNQPVRGGSELRQMFVPREGMVFVVADYSSIELRILAYYMNDAEFKAIVEESDPFLWLGSQIYQTEDQSEWKVGRGPLKNGFYAMTYGAGGPKIAQTIGGGMTADEGRMLSRQIKQVLGPNFRQLQNNIRKQVESKGYLFTIGRRKQVVPTDRSYVGLNALIQGSAADVMKWGLGNASVALAQIGGYPVLVVHDEIVAEVPKGDADEGLYLLRDAMEQATDLVPLAVDGVICPNNYGEAK